MEKFNNETYENEKRVQSLFPPLDKMFVEGPSDLDVLFP